MAEPQFPPWPTIDFAAFGPVETQPLGRNRALTAAFLARNWSMIPHVTHHDWVDATGFEARRRVWNDRPGAARVTPLVPLIKAVATALAEFPMFNTSLDAAARTLTWKRYVHIGVATETKAGLLVPVIRDCDRKDLATIAAKLADKTERARVKGLPMSEMSGGCFTVTSLGNLGGRFFTPIINAPEVAILGVCPMALHPVPDGDRTAWRRMLPLSLSYDHRVINGADAARFVTCLGRMMDSEMLFAA